MNQFKEFGIETTLKAFVGDKIKIERLLNVKVIVHDYKIEPSKYKGDCIYLQITHNNEKRILFSGSVFLIETLKKVPQDKFPFETTIVRVNEHFELS